MNPTALIRSTSSLNRISRSLTGFSSGITRASFLARNIAKNINADNRFKKSVIETEKTFFRKRSEARLRKKREDNVESSSLSVGNILKKQSKVLGDTSKGFFTRLLDFLGLTILGWIITNIPKIMKSITNLVSRVKDLSTSLRGHIDNVKSFLGAMGEKLIEIRDRFDPFDFEESITKGEKEFKIINQNIASVNSDFVSAINSYADTSDLAEIVAQNLNLPTEEDIDEDQDQDQDQDVDQDKDETEGITTMATGGLLKKGETAIVGDDPTGEGKESRELIVADKDLQVIPNNVLGSLESIASNISGEKTKEALLSNQDELKKVKKIISQQERSIKDALGNLKIGEEYNINNPPSKDDYPRTVSGRRQFTKDFKQWIKDNPLGTKFGQKVEPSNTISELTPAISSLMEQLKNTGEEIKPQLKDAHDQIKEVIDTPEVQDKIQSIKTKMKGVVEEITPERKGQIITIPIGSNSSDQFTAIPVKQESHSGGRSKQLNTNEYYKHLTALVTAYT
tara:strand:+ start:6849 stop:8378 length:1530 start_codon:yes stop_codon:yes gene_type:complete